jgi:hypothetical protein
LNFAENQISGGFETLLPLTKLEQIYLDKNLISGAFPSSLLQLKMLQMLSLTEINFLEIFPKTFLPSRF